MRKVPLQRPTLVPLPNGGAWTKTRELCSGLNPATLVSQLWQVRLSLILSSEKNSACLHSTRDSSYKDLV